MSDLIASNYSKLALQTLSPHGKDTMARLYELTPEYLSSIARLYSMLSELDFDNFKRLIFYAPPGEDIEHRGMAMLVHGVTGLLSEVFELIDCVHDCPNLSVDLSTLEVQAEPLDIRHNIDKRNLTEELGDMIWYINLIAASHDIDFNLLLRKNIAKLAVRYPSKFDIEATNNRDRTAEDDALDYEDKILQKIEAKLQDESDPFKFTGFFEEFKK